MSYESKMRNDLALIYFKMSVLEITILNYIFFTKNMQNVLL